MLSFVKLLYSFPDPPSCSPRMLGRCDTTQVNADVIRMWTPINLLHRDVVLAEAIHLWVACTYSQVMEVGATRVFPALTHALHMSSDKLQDRNLVAIVPLTPGATSYWGPRPAIYGG